MKKIYQLFLIAIIALAGCTEDADKWSDTMKDANVGGAIPYLRFYTPKIFDLQNLDNTSMKFTLNVGAEGEGKNYTKVNIYKSFNGGDEVLHAEYTNAQIPAEINMTIEDALAGIPGGPTAGSLVGGDAFEWRFEMVFPDGSNGEYNVDALGTFPTFQSFLASSPDFDISGSYTMNLILDEVGVASQTASVDIAKIGGTADSQYMLSEGSAELVLNWFGLALPYRIIYIGNNTFNLWARAEDWLADFFGFVGTVTYDPGTGKLNFDGVWDESYGGISGLKLQYELVPAS